MAINVTAAPLGKQTQTVSFGGTSLETFTYRPSGEINGVFLTFHGNSRNAEGARNMAIDVAEEYGLYVVAPEFSSSRFDNSEYQFGGIVENGRLMPESQWTVNLVDNIAEWAHAKVGNDPDDETILFGHSGGGQFVSRVAAFGPDATFDKMIIANPSTHVRASLTENIPYGFDGYMSSAEEEAYLKDYLADPITIYLGSEDDNPNDPDLARHAEAMRQGDDRLERGLNTYYEARAFAEARDWEFNWELVIADDVGHSSSGMLRAPEFHQDVWW